MRDNYSDFRTLSGTVNSILYALYVAISDEDVATCICLLFGGQSTILEAKEISMFGFVTP